MFRMGVCPTLRIIGRIESPICTTADLDDTFTLGIMLHKLGEYDILPSIDTFSYPVFQRAGYGRLSERRSNDGSSTDKLTDNL